MALEHILSRTDYLSGREKHFPSGDALSWYIRRHRERLNQRGALVVINKRVLIDAPVMDQAVIEIGRELAGEVA